MRCRFASVLVCLLLTIERPALAAQGPVPETGGTSGSPRREGGSSRPTGSSAPRSVPRDQPKAAPAATARISGRVIGGESGLPLRRALVRIHGETLEESRVTTTDENGRYEFVELPPGRLFLYASKGGYVSVPYGQRRPNEGPRPLEIAEGQRIDGINFNLPKGAVIAGRITDEFGEPVAGLGVTVLTYRYVEGRRQLVPAGMHAAQTDDLGRFRVFGLSAGEYYLKTSGESGGMFMEAKSDKRSGFAGTYFPGTLGVGEAQRLRVGTGQELSSVNFAVLPARMVRVSGIVLDSEGQPVSGGYIMVQENTKGSMMYTVSAGGLIRPDGSFTISSLSPGDYVLHVGLHMHGDERESAAVPVSVAAEDIEGLTIVTLPGALISGQMMFETEPRATIKPTEFMFYATSIGPLSPMRGGGVKVNDDWTFETRAHEGPLLIRGAKLPEGWVLKAVLHDGADVTDTGIDIKAGGRIDGVQLVLSNRIATVTGAVVDDRGRQARDYAVVVFPVDAERWGPSSRHLFAARATQQGRFEISKLPAGQYLAAAVASLEDGQHTDPEYLAGLRSVATPFDLGEGERKLLTLPLLRSP